MLYLSPKRLYAYTYTAPDINDELLGELKPFAVDLLHFHPGKRIYFATDMACGQWSHHQVFALLRAALEEAAGDQWAALYAPLAGVGTTQGEFLLHADLYVPNVLFNVFENVPRDGSGRSILLPIDEFLSIIDELVPHTARNRMIELLTAPLQEDAYQEFYGLLHDNHRWTTRLNRALKIRQRPILLHAHEGYLLHDRSWLHGREAPTGGVAKNRVRRLVYRAPA